MNILNKSVVEIELDGTKFRKYDDGHWEEYDDALDYWHVIRENNHPIETEYISYLDHVKSVEQFLKFCKPPHTNNIGATESFLKIIEYYDPNLVDLLTNNVDGVKCLKS